MSSDELKTIIDSYRDSNIALYGLGTETERFLSGYGDELNVVGLLDGFRVEGEIYGFPIISLDDAIDIGVRLIIVVARPGSCKAIKKRIGELCRKNGIALFDVRGRDLLADVSVAYDFSGINGESRQALLAKIENADIVSFDLFDTLVTRQVLSYTDVFAIMDIRLREKGIVIPGFESLRLQAEKELSKHRALRLEDIYSFVFAESGGISVTEEELARMEFETDLTTVIARRDVCDVFREAASAGKTVVVTTDSYYSEKRIRTVLRKAGIDVADNVLVSCEYGTAKTQDLFSKLEELYPGKKMLHIGDDEYADMEKASAHGFDTYHVYSGADLFDCLGGLDFENDIKDLSDRIKVGMLVSEMLNSPFRFENEPERLAVYDSSQIGYLFCAPIVTDFLHWIRKELTLQGFDQFLFCARDGYLLIRLFEMISSDINAKYFLTSRIAAIRAGMENEEDIEYVDSMKYSGSVEDALRTRFGIMTDPGGKEERIQAILESSAVQRENYMKYIDKLRLGNGRIGMFDFVAKGTTQMYLQKLFGQQIKGFYFLQLEPEFMADKGLDIEPFYSEDEKDNSAIFDNYYILETVLTSPSPQIIEFDENGDPVFADETRSDSDIRVFEKMQAGIKRYFEEYISLVPMAARTENKALDEKMLALVNKVQIRDDDFLAIKVEDPFFGRMTDIRDVILN